MLIQEKKNILIVNTIQYGYHTDSMMYCRYINKSQFNVTYFCFDMGFPKTETKDLAIVYVPINRNKIVRYYIFTKSLFHYLNRTKFHCVFHIYNKFTLLMRLFCIKFDFILDIRTGSLSQTEIVRKWKNFEITFTALFYKKVSVISESLRKELGISKKKYQYLPLGGQYINSPKKSFTNINLLYIGTLDQRNIHETVSGVACFKKKYPNITITYDIVGAGNTQTTQKLATGINQNNLQDIVIHHGRKKHNDLIDFFYRCNVGVVYVPITKWYNFQPATKLFECVLAGMPVIATNTFENKISLKENSGILCDDHAEGFCRAISEIYNNQLLWDSDKIKEMYKTSTWEYIVKNNFEKIVG
jgi:hypothetical protein